MEEAVRRCPDLSGKPFPLASYFGEKKEGKNKGNRLDGIPAQLREATEKYDFDAARTFFTEMASRNSRNPLRALADTLARHLAATAAHAGMGLDQKLDSESGFSVRRDGRLRFNCETFVGLAQSDLQDIQGLHFRHITLNPIGVSEKITTAGQLKLKSISPAIFRLPHSVEAFNYGIDDIPKTTEIFRHRIMVVSDNSGHHLLIDNSRVMYLEGDIVAEIDSIYGGYNDISWDNPEGKSRIKR